MASIRLTLGALVIMAGTSAAVRGRSGDLQDRAVLRCGLDRHHGHHGHGRGNPQGAGLHAKVRGSLRPVTYTSMKNKNIDVFLGNWMPTMEADRKPFIEDKSVEVIRANLREAKYTLAVPAYAS
jgi:hypothetical protein